eukprot:1911081-Prorocentrum_lima.AAC.1
MAFIDGHRSPHKTTAEEIRIRGEHLERRYDNVEVIKVAELFVFDALSLVSRAVETDTAHAGAESVHLLEPIAQDA